jgi:hypothetical protein
MKWLIMIIAVVVVIVIIAVLRKPTSVPPQQRATHELKRYNSHRPLLKQFADLTSLDFVKYPVWVNCHVVDYDRDWYDETDEETFRPWEGALPIDPAEAIFLVKAKMTLADGTEYDGFITPQEDSNKPDLGTMQPCLFAQPGKIISFWFGMIGPSQEDIRGVYETLGKSVEQVFPIQFKAEDGLAKGIVSGTILGFYKTGKNDEVIVVK